jgi:hypothetical protein
VQFTKLPEAGVPRIGLTNVGLFNVGLLLKTRFPDPVTPVGLIVTPPTVSVPLIATFPLKAAGPPTVKPPIIFKLEKLGLPVM